MIFVNIFGQVTPPPAYGQLLAFGSGSGLVGLVNNLLGLLTSLAGIFVIVNFVIAGYLYLGSNGVPQKITEAGNKILQSAIGIGIVGIAYVVAAIVGKLLFNDATILLKPKLFILF